MTPADQYSDCNLFSSLKCFTSYSLLSHSLQPTSSMYRSKSPNGNMINNIYKNSCWCLSSFTWHASHTKIILLLRYLLISVGRFPEGTLYCLSHPSRQAWMARAKRSTISSTVFMQRAWISQTSSSDHGQPACNLSSPRCQFSNMILRTRPMRHYISNLVAFIDYNPLDSHIWEIDHSSFLHFVDQLFIQVWPSYP